MYKILVETGQVANLKQTPYRKITNKTSQLKQSQNEKEAISIFECPEIKGRIHLYKNYRSEHQEEQAKINLAANKIDIKTQALFVDRIRKDDFKTFMERLKQSENQIDIIDTVIEPGVQINLSVIIFFKSILASEQIYQLSLLHYQALPLYLHQSIIALFPQGKDRSRECLALVNPQLSIQAESFAEHQKWVQLPRCLKCLQRLEYDLTGITPTIFQQLSKSQAGLTCQTCLTLSGMQSIICALCDTPEDNWICMVCSRVGCGRYKNGDAFRHFLCEGHIITMDLETQRVWNYLADCFSHRVIPLQKQEITLKFPQVSQRHQRYEESLEGAFWEYCSVVSEQLDRQRAFYQRQRNQQEESFRKEVVRMDELIASTKNELSQREEMLKKMTKRHKKSERKLQEVKESCKMQREILANYQKTIREQVKQQSVAQIQRNSDKIQQKLKILQSIDLQIQSILAKLTE